MTDHARPTLNLGFLGGGLNSAVGYTHFAASHMDGLFKVAAGCFSRDADINLATAEQFGVQDDRAYANVSELLAREADTLDAICVITPTPLHLESVSAILEAGVPVICEKALTTSAENATQMVALANTKQTPLAVTFNYIGYPMVREAKALIDSGALGALQHLAIEMPQESFVREGASPQTWRKLDYDIPCVSLDLGVHVVHMADFLSGGLAHEAVFSAEGRYGDVPGVVDTVYTTLKLEGGVLAVLSWGKAALGYRNGLSFRAFCSKGSLFWDQMSPELLICNKKDGQRHIIDRGQVGLLEANKGRYNRFKAGHPSGFIEAFANIYSDLHDCLCGKASMEDSHLSGEVALSGLRRLSAIHSAKTF